MGLGGEPVVWLRFSSALLGSIRYRTAFHEQLEALAAAIADVFGVAGRAMQDATQALLGADAALAECVIGGHDEMMLNEVRAEQDAFTLLALQARWLLISAWSWPP